MSIADHLIKSVKTVTKKWKKQRKSEIRNSNAALRRDEAMYSCRVNQTDVAWEVIPKAYAKASYNGTLPAHARQIFYAARKEIQEQTGRTLKSVYFTQTLLPRFINENPQLTEDWWVVYDARGHLIEPHSEWRQVKDVPLGTLEVDDYLLKTHSSTDTDLSIPQFPDWYSTTGPKNRYGAILFIEKEGFNPLFRETKLAEKYDLAIMSTKGQSLLPRVDWWMNYATATFRC